MSTITLAIELDAINCGSCGGTYAINSRYHSDARQKGTSWHCPYCGCGWGYQDGGENARLKNKLAEIQGIAERERMSRINAEKEAAYFLKSRDEVARTLKRERKRTSNGVCPCCNRSFTNLRRHMATKHPKHTER